MSESWKDKYPKNNEYQPSETVKSLKAPYKLSDEELIQLHCPNREYCIKIRCVPKKCPYKMLEKELESAIGKRVEAEKNYESMIVIAREWKDKYDVVQGCNQNEIGRRKDAEDCLAKVQGYL